MIYKYLTKENIENFISSAIREDIGEGDHSANACISDSAISRAQLKIKSNGIIAGLELSEAIFKHLNPDFNIEFNFKDGQEVKEGDVAFVIEGNTRKMLSAERLVLNCLQRMSAIATRTRSLHKLIEHTPSKILDTRKTTPNFRLPEKWAVRIGGGINHRYALYDMILIKDNHVDFAGGIENAIRMANKYIVEKELDLEIEIETRNLKEVEEVMNIGGVHRIMLDNMSVEDMRNAIIKIDGKYETEASGGITENTIVKVAETGVDFISIGALTHSYSSMDMSLKAF